MNGKTPTYRPGTLAISPMIGSQSSTPFTYPAQARSRRASASAGTTASASARLARSDPGSTTGSPEDEIRAGQPPPIRSEPMRACLSVSMSPAKYMRCVTSGSTGSVTLAWIAWPTTGRSTPRRPVT